MTNQVIIPPSISCLIGFLLLFQMQVTSYSNTLTRYSYTSMTNTHKTIRDCRREFYFPTISYQRGLRNVHTLEYVLNKNKYFQVSSNTTEPIKCGGNYIILSTQCKAKNNYSHNLMLFSNQSNVSNIVYLKGGVPRLTFLLSVKPSYIGHFLYVHVTYFKHPKLYATLLQPLWYIFTFFEIFTFFSYNYKHNDNLRKYRMMLFNKTDDEI
jgi:hypothetical protein